MSRVPAAGALKRLALSAAARRGGFTLARQLTAQPARIVMYHHFSAEPCADRTSAQMLRRQLLHLRRHFHPVRLTELAVRLAGGDAPAAGSVAITVDDGHADFLRVAVPILRELEIPATLFVLSELSNSGAWLWVDKWEYLHAQTPARAGGPADLAP